MMLEDFFLILGRKKTTCMSSNIRIKRICDHCGSQFEAKQTRTKFCSPSCSKLNYKRRVKLEKIQGSEIETLIKRIEPLLLIQQKQFLSVVETAELLGVGESTAREMVFNRILVSRKIGNRIIIRRIDIDNLFKT